MHDSAAEGVKDIRYNADDSEQVDADQLEFKSQGYDKEHLTVLTLDDEVLHDLCLTKSGLQAHLSRDNPRD